MKRLLYGSILILCSLSYQACDIFNPPCKFEEFVIPVEIYPMKDTFHVGDTMHVHIEFLSLHYSYSASEPKVEFKNCIASRFHFSLLDGLREDDNYQIYLNELNKRDAFPPGSSEEYKNGANFTFYVVE